MRNGKKVTIKDIAKEAETSIATVSRVINNSNYPVSKELRNRILSIVSQVNYSHGSSALNSPRRQNRDVAILIPNISNPFYPQAILGIESVLHEKGYNILLYNTLRSKQRENECLELLQERQVRGVIISTVENDAESLAAYANQGMQLVLLDQAGSLPNCPSIHFDSSRGARMAMEYLFKNGHRHIAFATTPLVRSTRIDTYQGYCEALKGANIYYRSDYIFVARDELVASDQNYELAAGRLLAQEFINSGCDATAILCVNDMLAIGLINTLIEHGVHIPGDVSVVGFDDIPFAGVYNPQLTTVRYPIYEAGRLAALLLESMLDGSAGHLGLCMNLEPCFVPRQTVKNLLQDITANQ